MQSRRTPYTAPALAQRETVHTEGRGMNLFSARYQKWVNGEVIEGLITDDKEEGSLIAIPVR